MKELRLFLFVITLIMFALLISNIVVIRTLSGVSTIPVSYPTPPPVEASVGTRLDYDQALTTYREIAIEVIKSSERVLDIAKWIAGAVLTLVTVAAGSVIYIMKSVIEAKTAAENSAKSAEEAQKAASKSEELFKEIEHQVKIAGYDIERLLRLETLARIESYTLDILAEDPGRAKVAQMTLIELSRDKDPVVRRKCVQAVILATDYAEAKQRLQQNSALITRLEELASEAEKERGVRVEAIRALEKLGVRKYKETLLG